MTGPAPAVLLMAAPDPYGGELERMLGSERLRELHGELVARAEEWALTVAPGAVECTEDGERLSDAIPRVFAAHDGPVLVVWPTLPQFRSEHAAAALGDLDAGSDVVIGPVIDGGLYLLGLARPIPELVSIPEGRLRDPDVMTIVFTAAQDSGLEVGILRAERALRDASDVRAALADPLLPGALREILARAG